MGAMKDQQDANLSRAGAAPIPVQNHWRTFGIVLITALVTLLLAYLLFTRYLFPDHFNPVILSEREQKRLDEKLDQLERGKPSLRPKRYAETHADRSIRLTEKELNAMLSSNADLAQKMAIDLSDDLASVNVLIDMDPDFPLLGGKTLRVSAGLGLGLVNGRPSAVLKGVSLWGVPLPNAWLGNLKNRDLLQELGGSSGFWQAMRDGVKRIEVRDGELLIELNE